MEIYLIPLGSGYGLYAEAPAPTAPRVEPAKRGMMGRVADRGRAWVASLEHEDPQARGDGGWRSRFRHWAAGRVREQRVLWQLRGEQTVTIVAAADCPDRQAIDIVQRLLKRDAERHGRWIAIDAAGLIGSAVFMLLPGPNVVAYYFALSLGGHVLSWKGARHARQRICWQVRQDEALADLRQAIGAPADERDRRVHAIADRLHLPSLPGYLARAGSRSA
ncbi:MAG TPA: hypothetical protein VIC33_10435 [Vicinamibacterales bacterium]|jgi:hypothetical protein